MLELVENLGAVRMKWNYFTCEKAMSLEERAQAKYYELSCVPSPDCYVETLTPKRRLSGEEGR